MSDMMTQRQITHRFLAEPTDINFFGKVHGGAVMKWIDQAGYTCAVGWSGQYCVTAHVGGIQFVHPIAIGEIVELQAKVIYTGRTSMHIAVHVRAGDPRGSDLKQTTHCVIVFVGIDENGRPVPVPSWEPETPADVALAEYAVKLMELRQSIEAEVETPPTEN